MSCKQKKHGEDIQLWRDKVGISSFLEIMIPAGLILTIAIKLLFNKNGKAVAVYLALVLCPIFLFYFKEAFLLLKKSKLSKVVIGFVFIFSITLFRGGGGLELKKWFHFFEFCAGVMALPFALKLLQKNANLFRSTIRILFICLAIAGIYSIISFSHTHNVSRIQYHIGDVHPILIGQRFGFLFILFLVFIAGEPKKSWICFVVDCFLMVIFLLVVIYTYSRAAYIGVLISAGAFLVFKGRDKYFYWLICSAISLSIISSKFFVFFFSKTEDVEIISKVVGRGSAGRFKIWSELVSRMHGLDFLIGRGYWASDTTIEVFGPSGVHPHGIYMFSFYHGGLLLLLMHVFVVCFAFIIGIKSAKRGYIFLLLLFLFSFFPALTEGIYIFGLRGGELRFPVILFWLLVGVAIFQENENKAMENKYEL